MQDFKINSAFKLHNGVEMPCLGLGVFKAQDGDEVVNAVQGAIDTGYRHIDTAAIYRNEKGVGKGIKNSGIDRKNIFLTSKVWNADQGYDSTIKALQTSLGKLGTDYLDLYLVHWPVKGKYKETWRAMEKLYSEGKVRAIGVSNFMQHHLEDIIRDASIVPMVNQMEFHPSLIQNDLLNFCAENKIQYEAWSPLMRGDIFSFEELNKMAEKYGKTTAQLVLRWNLQKGVVTIPKSVRLERIQENADIFDFEISETDMLLIEKMDQNKRIGPDPDNFDF
jgi:diketogulonate reductase-like aldo/keto reductase